MFTTPGSRAGRKTANRLRQGHFTASHALGVVASGTFTPDPTKRGFQHYTNGGVHTLAPPAETCSVVVDITNNAIAGAITTSAFTKVDGDAFATTNAQGFRCYITVGNLGSHLNVKRMV